MDELGGLLASAGARFAGADRGALATALAFQGGNVFFRALAWRNVLAAAYPRERVPLLGVGASYAAGMALNGFVPARAGEALKIALVRTQIRNSSVVTIAAAGTVILVLDAVLGALFLGLTFWCGVLPAPPRVGLVASVGAHPLTTAGVALALAAIAALAVRRFGSRGRSFVAKLARGGAILRSPGAYLARVVLPQLGAWACRAGVAFSLLVAFGLPATVPLALLVVVAGGVSTLVPGTPGGAGTQQLLLVYALGAVASTSAALSFSIGMQVGITAVNSLVGVAALMLLTRSLRPFRAVRALRTRA
ncbi:MAG TPA: lysylphosphatidylglycerol synthase domain-containing protein [Gaiellaceae bacterium]|jgi:uncharacterized membrane protein YbhN (UPF0104 family)